MRMRKRITAWVTAIVLALSLMPQAALAIAIDESVETLPAKGINLLKVTTVEDFEAGATDGLTILPNVGNGALTLRNGETEGTFVSAIYETETYNMMTASWNASIYDGGEVEIWARARQDGQWSDWMSWGPFTPYATRGSEDHKSGALAWIDQDIFRMDAGVADAVQMKAEVRRASTDIESPVLRQLSMTFNGGEMERVFAEDDGIAFDDLPLKALVEAPAYAQGVRHPSIGGSICSPTTMTMLMNARVPELDLLPEEYALNIQDESEGIFGNWSFTVSGAGLYGFEAYVQFASPEILMQELANGRTVGISVRYNHNTPDNDYYLEGAYGTTSGHLISIIGYEFEDGVRDMDHLYFYSGDSFSGSDVTSYHRYKWTQLKNCWGANATTYIIPSLEQEENADVTGITRVNAALEPDEYETTAFTLVDKNGNAIDMERFISGGGVLGYTVEGVQADMMDGLVDGSASVVYEKPMQMTANNIFYYDLSCEDDGTIQLDTNAILTRHEVPAGESREITVYGFSDRGYLYTAVINACYIPEEVIVAPETPASSASVQVRNAPEQVSASVEVNDLTGDTIYLGLKAPEGIDPADARVEVDGRTVPVETYTDDNGADYAVIPVDAGALSLEITAQWSSSATRSYQIQLAGVILEDEAIRVEGNLVSVDLENGRANGKLVQTANGLTLAAGETYAEYYSPVYDGFDWEYAMASLSAYVPGDSSVDLQIRAFTQRNEIWSDWHSFGRAGVGSASFSTSESDTDTNMDTDVLLIRGSSATANAQRFQVRLVFRSGSKGEQPAVYGADVTYKKSAYDPAEAVYTGDTAAADLPASAGKDIPGYSAYAYAPGMSAWRFENLELIALNGQGADQLFEEVALAAYDWSTGWGNWTMTNYKPGIFGYRAYTQYGADATMVQQAIADGNIVGLYVNGSKVPSTNSGTSSQTVVYAYYTNADGEVIFRLICPRGDVSELNGKAVYGECTAAELNEAIASMSSTNARGVMYVIGQKEYASSWQRVQAEANVTGTASQAFTMVTDSEILNIPASWSYNDFGRGGVLAYTLASETPANGKLAAGDFHYDLESNGDGTFAIPTAMQAELDAFGSAEIYIIRNDGVTYTAHLEHYHTWDEGVVTVQPSVGKRGECVYTCTQCGKTRTEVLSALPGVPSGPSGSSGSSGGGNKPGTGTGTGDTPNTGDTPDVPQQSFTDVPATSWASEAISFVAQNGLMQGVGNGGFAPSAATTRGMLMTILARHAGQDTSGAGPWYEKGMQWALAQGISDGTTPEKSLTRQELVTMLYRYAGMPTASGSLTGFSDSAQVSTWAQNAMAWAVENGILQGMGNNQLNPTGTVTRDQMAAFLMRFCNLTQP